MILFDHKLFYANYAYDYYLYKLGTLRAILADTAKFDKDFLSTIVEGTDQTGYTRFIKSEVRMTCFHAIETLFELILALEPKDGILRDEKILHSLVTADPAINYRRIREISKDINTLNFLNNICIQDGQIPLWMHIFYFQLNLDLPDDAKDKFLESEKAIKHFIKHIADIFSDREEYNAYKHGLRIMHTLDFVSIGVENDPSQMVDDLSDSMTLLTFEKGPKKTDKPTAEIIDVISFDTNVDMEIIQICYYMINNIINRRKSFYVFGKKSTKGSLFTVSDMKKSLAPGISGRIRARTPIKDL
jgi:hypothetical protein